MKIREIIRPLEADGWYQVACEGSHRQFKHPVKQGRVTVAGHLGDELDKGTLNSILKQAGLKQRRRIRLKMLQYPVVIERAKKNYAAFCPDLPGCVATGHTLEETLTNMERAIEIHLKGLREDGLPIPAPSRQLTYRVNSYELITSVQVPL